MESKHFRKGCDGEYSTEEKYINLVIKEQFYLQQETTVRLSAEAIYQLILNIHHRVNYLTIVNYLNKRWKSTCEAVNFGYRMSFMHDDYICSKDRCFMFKVEEFLTNEELEDFYLMMNPEKQ